jgi:glyoxylase-like metal-dependent hydrolase (beta-lactamase superfamily II)
MRLVEGDYEITSGVEIFETPGHTPGHMSARIYSKKESLLVVGDVLVNPFYVFESGRAFQSDKDPVLGIKTRQTLLAQAIADQSLLASAHFSEPGVGSVKNHENRLKFIPR